MHGNDYPNCCTTRVTKTQSDRNQLEPKMYRKSLFAAKCKLRIHKTKFDLIRLTEVDRFETATYLHQNLHEITAQYAHCTLHNQHILSLKRFSVSVG